MMHKVTFPLAALLAGILLSTATAHATAKAVATHFPDLAPAGTEPTCKF